MNSREITLWLDGRWYDALSRQLKGETVEDKLNEHLDELINALIPDTEYSRISQEIWQEEQENKTFTAQSGGGMVSATVNGKHELVSMEINPEAVDPEDVEMLQDMVIAAVNEAMRAADTDAANNMSRLTGGLNLGGLF